MNPARPQGIVSGFDGGSDSRKILVSVERVLERRPRSPEPSGQREPAALLPGRDDDVGHQFAQITVGFEDDDLALRPVAAFE